MKEGEWEEAEEMNWVTSHQHIDYFKQQTRGEEGCISPYGYQLQESAWRIIMIADRYETLLLISLRFNYAGVFAIYFSVWVNGFVN